MEERLWEYIDGLSSTEERTIIEQLLQADAEWRSKYGELLEVNQLVSASELEAPSMRFTKNVMEEISKLHIAPATKSYINKRVIWGLGIFFLVMVVAILIYGFGQINWANTQGSSFTDKLGKIDSSKFFNNNWITGFLMVNVVLGLIMLDSYFSSKRKDYRKEA